MGMQMVLTEAEQLEARTWMAKAPPHQVAMLGPSKATIGDRSVLLVRDPTYDAASGSLRFDAEHLIVLNLGSTSALLVLSSPAPSEPKRAHREPTRSGAIGPGDKEFLQRAYDLLPKELAEAMDAVLEAVRCESPGDLSRSDTSKFVNSPDNFWTVIVQPRDRSLRFTVRGKPERFTPSPLQVKDDRPGYSAFKMNEAAQSEAVLAVLSAARRKG